MSITSMADALARDVRDALRGLLGARLFTAVALGTLAIGSGANTAMFSVIDGVLLKPLPYPDADDLVAVWHDAPGAPGLASVSGGLRLSASLAITYQDENVSFEHIGMWNGGVANITGVAEPEVVPIVGTLGGVLQALGVPPLVGRWLEPADEDPNGPFRVLLGYAYWQRRFGGDPNVVGRTLGVNGLSAQIVGVMPEGFRVVDTAADLIGPMRFPRVGLIPPPFCCTGIARLKDGVTIEQANADLARLLPVWLERFPFPGDRAAEETYLDTWRVTPAIRPLAQDVVGNVGNTLWIVMGTIGVVLTIACANVMNLLLVRAEKRRPELAVRAALGAGAWRIARVLLLESLLLGLAGGAAGVGLAYGALALIKRLAPATLPRVDAIALDGRTLLVTFGVAVLAGVLLGLVPALAHASPRSSAALRAGGRGALRSAAQHRAQSALVIAQVALALVLLVSAGLMIRTFDALRNVEPGFTEPETVQTVRVAIPPLLEPDGARVVRLQHAIVDAIAAIPSVSAVGFATSVPLDGAYGNWDDISVEGREADPDEASVALRNFESVSPGFFRTLGARLVAGRDFTWTDLEEARPVALISENLARELWTDPAAAVGARIGLGNTPGTWREVVGVVQATRDNGLQEPAPATVYWPPRMTDFYLNEPEYLTRNIVIAVRSPLAGNEALLRQIQQAVWSVNGSLPIAEPQTMQALQGRSLARTSFTLVMLGLAAAAALVLGVVGLYGVLSYVIAQRRREIAIRLALGARPAAVTRAFVRYGLSLAALGVVLGLGAALAVTRLMASLLFAIEPVDAPSYAAGAALLTAVAALACYGPARRAANVDPAETLAAD